MKARDAHNSIKYLMRQGRKWGPVQQHLSDITLKSGAKAGLMGLGAAGLVGKGAYDFYKGTVEKGQAAKDRDQARRAIRAERYKTASTTGGGKPKFRMSQGMKGALVAGGAIAGSSLLVSGLHEMYDNLRKAIFTGKYFKDMVNANPEIKENLDREPDTVPRIKMIFKSVVDHNPDVAADPLTAAAVMRPAIAQVFANNGKDMTINGVEIQPHNFAGYQNELPVPGLRDLVSMRKDTHSVRQPSNVMGSVGGNLASSILASE